MDEDLESYWKEVRNIPTIQLVSGRISNLREGVEIAALKAKAQLVQRLNKDPNATINAENMAEWIMYGVQTFVEQWEEDLRRRDISSLVEIVLESRSLSPTELKGFVRALPYSLVERIVQEGSIGREATGIHALFAVEHAHRSKLLPQGDDYTLEREPNGHKLMVTLRPRQLGGEPLRFRLDENFNLDAMNGVDRESETR